MSRELSWRGWRLPARAIAATAVLVLTMPTSFIAASASTSFGPARTEPLVVTPETALTGFGATSSEVAVQGEPVNRSVALVYGSRTLLTF